MVSWIYLRFAISQHEPVTKDFQLRLSFAGCKMSLELLVPIGGEQRLQVTDGQPLTGQLLLKQLHFGPNILHLSCDLKNMHVHGA